MEGLKERVNQLSPEERNKLIEVLKRRKDAPRVSKGTSDDLSFSLMFFSSRGIGRDTGKYEIFLKCAEIADRGSFEAIWIPERHFHEFGGLFPNPAVLASALSVATHRVRIRAGSVVLPLHEPLRIVEEWSVVDNLSGGRVDLAFAVGWNPNDYALAPERYDERVRHTFEGIDEIKKLWRGEPARRKNGLGEAVVVNPFPTPVQKELNIWLTCTSGKERFEEAGRLGANILTALLFQSVEELEEKLRIYRQARQSAGHDPDSGRVTLMLHTFVWNDEAEALKRVKGAFCEYLRSSIGLWNVNHEGLAAMDENKTSQVVEFAFEKYSRQQALFGSPVSCLRTAERFRQIGVNEIACLVDFGVDAEDTVAALAHLQELIRLSRNTTIPSFYDSIANLVPTQHEEEAFLTFGCFPERTPGFSWLRTMAFPEENASHTRLAIQSQQELRRRLFEKVDFKDVGTAFDFGCGYGTDVIALALKYPWIDLTGFTLSPRQARHANDKIISHGIGERVRVLNRDSIRDPFLANYDLIFGFEVAVYIRDKRSLFKRLRSHLNDGGQIVLAEFISNTTKSIIHEETSSFIPTVEEWSEIFADAGLEVTSALDVRHEIANFLDDPHFGKNLGEAATRLRWPLETTTHLGAQQNLGGGLRSGLISYPLMTLRITDSGNRDECYSASLSSMRLAVANAGGSHRHKR